MAGYAKVFSDIVHSTVWREDVYTKVVWITMLVMADRHGLVMASIPGLADASKVSLEQCLSALEVLSSPDKYSRTKDFDGRRITEVDGGWLLLNFEKFRARKDDEEQRRRTAERVKKHRQKLSDDIKNGTVTENVTVTHSNPIAEAASSASPEASPTPEFTPIKTDTMSGGARPPSDVQTVFQYWKQKLNHPQAKLTPERQRKISIALKNYSAASLCRAIDGCAVTPHNMGQNDRGEVYDDIALIVRDAAHVERFTRNADAPPKINGAHHGKPSKLQRAAEAIRQSRPAGHNGGAAVVQDAGAEPGLRAIAGRPAACDAGDG